MNNTQTRATLDEHLKGIIDDMVRLSSKVDAAIDKAGFFKSSFVSSHRAAARSDCTTSSRKSLP